MVSFAAPAARADDVTIAAIQARLKTERPDLPERAVLRAMLFYEFMSVNLQNRDYVTIIDFSQPSYKERMYVIDMKTGASETYLVSHGRNSGLIYPTTFSNIEGSYMSSLGIYLTSNDYIGDNGLSMRLKGMEASNSNAEKRDIVMHGAEYVSHEYVRTNGYLGRSLGCPAIEMKYREKLVNQLKNGSVFLIYFSS